MIFRGNIGGAMKKYVITGVIMILGLTVALYSIFQMEYYEKEMWSWAQKARDANASGNQDLAKEYSAKADDAFKSRLIWGSFGTAGAFGAIIGLIAILYMLVRGDVIDIERIAIKRKEKEKQKEKGIDAKKREDNKNA